MKTTTHTWEPTREASTRRRDISWTAFLDLNPPKAIIRNVFCSEDEQSEHLSNASQSFLRRHVVNRVFAPGACPS